MKLGTFIKRIAPHTTSIVVTGLMAFAVGYWIVPRGSADSDAGAEAASLKKKEVVYSCSMCPQVRQPEPGLCPICGMDLIPVSDADGATQLEANQVALSERAKKMARIRTALVRQQAEPGVDLQLLGRIEPNESSFRTVTAWTAGRIDRLHVKVTGQSISKGQIVATLYSPEIFAAHQDLLVAIKQLERLSAGTQFAKKASDEALASTRERLQLLGVPNTDIARMEKAKAPWRQIPIRTPFGGTVLERATTEGAYVKTGTPLYKVANLRSVWVQLDAYENDLPRLALNQAVTIRVEGLAENTFEGKISFIDPTLDPMRRTARVRVEVRNKGGRLKPGMFVQALVNGEQRPTDKARPMLIPKNAAIFTGRRSLVYVEVPGADRPTYEARVVRLGPLSGGHYPVVAGLRSGERVVVNGAFVLDADLQIRGGQSMMMVADDSQGSIWDQVIQLSKPQRRRLKPVMEAYLQIQIALAADDLPKAQKAAQQLFRVAKRTSLTNPRRAAAALKPLVQVLVQQSKQLHMAESMEIARADFELLSEQIETLLRVFGNPLDTPVRHAYCSMAFDNRGAYWVQPGEVIDNAYFGDQMRQCGEIKATVAPGGFLEGAVVAQTEDEVPAPGSPQHGHGGH